MRTHNNQVLETFLNTSNNHELFKHEINIRPIKTNFETSTNIQL